jgi:TolA-binding protein
MQNYEAMGGSSGPGQAQLSGAEGILKEALAIRPLGDQDPKLLYMLGKVYVSWGRMGDARGAFQRILSDFPESPVVPKAKEAIEALPGH